MKSPLLECSSVDVHIGRIDCLTIMLPHWCPKIKEWGEGNFWKTYNYKLQNCPEETVLEKHKLLLSLSVSPELPGGLVLGFDSHVTSHSHISETNHYYSQEKTQFGKLPCWFRFTASFTWYQLKKTQTWKKRRYQFILWHYFLVGMTVTKFGPIAQICKGQNIYAKVLSIQCLGKLSQTKLEFLHQLEIVSPPPSFLTPP